jgi:hypothetical protein
MLSRRLDMLHHGSILLTKKRQWMWAISTPPRNHMGCPQAYDSSPSLPMCPAFESGMLGFNSRKKNVILWYFKVPDLRVFTSFHATSLFRLLLLGSSAAWNQPCHLRVYQPELMMTQWRVEYHCASPSMELGIMTDMPDNALGYAPIEGRRFTKDASP